MAAPDPAFLETLPPTTQIVINAAFFIAAVWMALRGYAGGKKASATEESRDLAILAGGAITDMKPVRNVDEKLGALIAETKRIADGVERIAHGIEARAEDDEVERRARLRAAEIIASERGKPRS